MTDGGGAWLQTPPDDVTLDSSFLPPQTSVWRASCDGVLYVRAPVRRDVPPRHSRCFQWLWFFRRRTEKVYLWRFTAFLRTASRLSRGSQVTVCHTGPGSARKSRALWDCKSEEANEVKHKPTKTRKNSSRFRQRPAMTPPTPDQVSGGPLGLLRTPEGGP